MTGPAAPCRRRVVVRYILVALAVTGLGGVAYLVAAHPPTQASYYPKCMFYQLTHLHCPGCGTGRAAHFALNGQLSTAIRFNPFAVVALPVVLFAVGRSAVQWVRGRSRQAGKPAHAGWIYLLAATLFVFAVARNLPWFPFTVLAPHEI